MDTSYVAHDYITLNTGATIYVGRGLVLSMSEKQKLNTNISTEAKLIGSDDSKLNMLGTKYFIEVQVYDIGKNIMYQDNPGAMLM